MGQALPRAHSALFSGARLQYPSPARITKSVEDSSSLPNCMHCRLSVSPRARRDGGSHRYLPFCRHLVSDDPIHRWQIELQPHAPIKKGKTRSAESDSPIPRGPRKTASRSPTSLVRTQPVGTHANLCIQRRCVQQRCIFRQHLQHLFPKRRIVFRREPLLNGDW